MDQSKIIANLETMLAKGQDNALLHYSLGSAHLSMGNALNAVPHLREAVSKDPNYSAAWKLLGKALGEAGDKHSAAEAFNQGIKVAEGKGDIQAAKEMRVFLKRLDK